MHDDISLDMGESGETCSPFTLSSGGLGPCIAIAAYDSRRKYGYMVHEPSAHGSSKVNEFLTDILQGSERKDLKIFVAGGGISPGASRDEREFVQQDRDFISNALTALFDRRQIHFEWNESDDTVELVLDTSNGKHYITAIPYDPDETIDFEEDYYTDLKDDEL
jgi:hypothetical protein